MKKYPTPLEQYLRIYIRNRPAFLSFIRSKEAYLYQPYLPLKPPVLDFGCGDGFFASVTVGKRIIDIGLDIKDSRVNEARKIGIYKKIVIYDGDQIPFSDNHFSTVISNSVLEHVFDIDQVLKEIYRVLKPGGHFIAPVISKRWEENFFFTTILGEGYKKWMRKKQNHINLLTRKKWDNIFSRTGFNIIDIKGHITPDVGKIIDLYHYLSLPSLLSYILIKKWVIFPHLAERVYCSKWIKDMISQDASIDNACALFYVLKK